MQKKRAAERLGAGVGAVHNWVKAYREGGMAALQTRNKNAAQNGRWIGSGVLDGFLEDESLFGELLRTPVSEGGVEPPVVGPPHVVVEVMPQLLDRGVVVPVHELLLQQPVHRFDHGVAVGPPLRGGDPLTSNTSSGSSISVSSNPPPRSAWNTWTSVSGKSSVANAPGTRPAYRAVRTACACTRPSCPVRA